MLSYNEKMVFNNPRGHIVFGIIFCFAGSLFVVAAIIGLLGMATLGSFVVDEDMRGNVPLVLGFLLIGFGGVIIGFLCIIGARRAAIILTDDSIQWKGIRGIFRTIPYRDVKDVFVENVDYEIIIVLRKPLPYNFFDGSRIPIANLFFDNKERKDKFKQELLKRISTVNR